VFFGFLLCGKGEISCRNDLWRPRLYKILSQENLSQVEKDSVIKAISALVVFLNILGEVKGATEKGAAWAAAGLAILSTVLQQAVGYLVIAIDVLCEAKNENFRSNGN
jgi:hypothetical protein